MVSSPFRTAAVVVAAGSLIACQQSPSGSPHIASQKPPASANASPSESSSAKALNKPSAALATESLSDGRPRRATLHIPAIGLRGLAVVPYVGKTDDARGTRIQDGGVAASPHGPRGGIGPGGLGNYQVTAHRTSSTQAFAKLPTLRVGERAIVVAGGARYVYEIRDTRQTSFRSTQSLAEQRTAVPGHPEKSATRAFITLSTCATPEDHAQGNYWADKFGNPEHRIDKVGVLVRTNVT